MKLRISGSTNTQNTFFLESFLFCYVSFPYFLKEHSFSKGTYLKRKLTFCPVNIAFTKPELVWLHMNPSLKAKPTDPTQITINISLPFTAFPYDGVTKQLHVVQEWSKWTSKPWDVCWRNWGHRSSLHLLSVRSLKEVGGSNL